MKIRFIVVDDAAFLREILKNIVTSEGGICVGEATNGADAIPLVQATLPDVVFLDMVMPVKNGVDTAKALKEIFPNIKIIGCSTIDDSTLVKQALDIGFDEYITKPFTRDQILQAISKILPHLGESTHGST